MRATPGYICASRRRTVIIVTRSWDTARRKRWNSLAFGCRAGGGVGELGRRIVLKRRGPGFYRVSWESKANDEVISRIPSAELENLLGS